MDSLDREEKERLFNEHIEQLGRKKRDKFRELLDEVGASADLTASWKDVKKLLKDDPRYIKFSSSDRVNENTSKNIETKMFLFKTIHYNIRFSSFYRNARKNLRNTSKTN